MMLELNLVGTGQNWEKNVAKCETFAIGQICRQVTATRRNCMTLQNSKQLNLFFSLQLCHHK